MIRKTFVATIAAAVLTAGGAFAAVLDANHATTGSANNNSNAGAIMASLGQTFTVLGNGTLDSVSFNILNIGNDGNGAATGDVTFDIRSTLAG